MKEKAKIQINVTCEQYNTIKTALTIERDRNRKFDNDDNDNEILHQIEDALSAVCAAQWEEN